MTLANSLASRWRCRLSFCVAMLAVMVISGGIPARAQDDAPQRRGSANRARRIYRANVDPHWFHDNDWFWYRNDLPEDAREFLLVEAATGSRQLAFDHAKLAQALSDAGVEDVNADHLPIDSLEFHLDERTLDFKVHGDPFQVNLDSYELQPVEPESADNDQTSSEEREVSRYSARTGPDTSITFVNKTQDPIEVFWVDTTGQRQSYGVLAPGESRDQHTFAGHVWEVDGKDGTLKGAWEAEEAHLRAEITGEMKKIKRGPPLRRGNRDRRPRERSQGDNRRSPDGQWEASIKDGNVFIHNVDQAGDVQLSTDGTEEIGYGMLQWAPDSQTLVAFKIEPGEELLTHLIESSPDAGGRAVLHSRPYPLPGDRFTTFELSLFHVDSQEQQKPEVDAIDFGRPRLRWKDDHRFTYEKTDRGHQRFRLIEVDTHSGDAQNLIDEQTDTFIWSAHTEAVDLQFVNWLEDSNEIIYATEKDGWRHLYLLDGETGDVKNAITSGEWVVRGIDRIDQEHRQVWFHASGMNADQDPYFMHYYRVNFDGTDLVALTDGNGTHRIDYSPDERYLIDTYSRVDMPPITELRRTEDGKLLCQLEQADISNLLASGWQPPEVFVAKGRDGQTDIWGIINRPDDYDPSKKYPIIEDIYAGPQDSFVPKAFSPTQRYRDLTDLGFVVVKIDGMGTANRSKAFHDVCWHNLKDGGFEDRILWMKSAAEKDAGLDISRVGIYGTSAGGQNAAAAVLFHPEFYKAAVAACGCHDNRMDKASWNEQWMGYPVGPQYAACSNIENAGKLQGHLMLIVGEMDSNVPPESTLRFVDALIRENKDFDLLVIPGAGHTSGGSYGRRRLQDFFVRHLLDESPPNRNQENPRSDTSRSREVGDNSSSERETQPAEVDLSDINAPQGNIDLLAERYRADRGSLERFYSHRNAPQRLARLLRFDQAWLKQLDEVELGELSPEDSRSLSELTTRVAQSRDEEIANWNEQRRLAPVLPFAEDLFRLTTGHRRGRRDDWKATAGEVDQLAANIEALTAQRTALAAAASDSGNTNDSGSQSESLPDAEAEPNQGDTVDEATDSDDEERDNDADNNQDTEQQTPTANQLAIRHVESLRGDVRRWFEFYDGYDPQFSWWLLKPHQRLDEALQAYQKSLRNSSVPLPLATPAVDVASQTDLETFLSELDLPADEIPVTELLAMPRGRMEAAINEYRNRQRAARRRGGRGRRGGGADEASSRQSRQAELQNWLQALHQLEYADLPPLDQADHLLLENHITYQLAKMELAEAGKDRMSSIPQDDSGITGTPVGRDALLLELQHEMIPYSPEELIEIANREYEWVEKELIKASNEMGYGDDWRAAVEEVKGMYVAPGEQPELINKLANDATDYVQRNNMITVPALAAETWRMQMMSPERQLVNPFFTGGEVISISFPTDTMSHSDKMQSLRGNNIPFAQATVHHELIPGHHLQGFMSSRYRSYRETFSTPFWGEGWALYWEMVLYDHSFAKSPEERIGFLVWRAHRCARIIFSLSFHLGKMSPGECVDFLVHNVGFERNNAAAEVRRSVGTGYPPLYQAAYMLGGLQLRELRRELVDSEKMTERDFHDAVLKENRIPIALLRAILTEQLAAPEEIRNWRFYPELP